jgi:hypothetical protein
MVAGVAGRHGMSAEPLPWGRRPLRDRDRRERPAGRREQLIGQRRQPAGRPGPAGLRVGRDEGSTLILTVFYGFLSLVLILLVVAATSLYLERKRLFTLADGAALVGAEAFGLDAVEVTQDGVRVALESPDVERAVRDYVMQSPHPGFDALAIDRAESVDGRSATVSLSSSWRPPLLSLLVPEGIRIDVTTVARSVFR